MIYLCVISRVSRVISRVISIICDLDAAICDFHSPARREEKIQTMRSRTSVSEMCPPSMVGRAGRGKFGCRQPFLIRKWLLLGAIPLFGAQRSSQTWHAAFPSTYTFRMEANLSAGLSCAQTKSICTIKLVDSAKTTESKMALKFAHLVSALPHGASRHS